MHPLVEQVLRQWEEKDWVGEELVLACQKHPQTKAYIRDPADFDEKAPDGGCQRPCNTIMTCKHKCPR